MKKFYFIVMVVVVCFLAGCSNSKAVTEIQEGLDKNDEQVIIGLETNNYDQKKALLLSRDLTTDGLLAICSNPYPLNIRNYKVQKWFKDAIVMADLTVEQEEKIAKLGRYSIALLHRSTLSSRGLIAICENHSDININNVYVQQLFVNAFNRTKLTEKEEKRIAELDHYTFDKALILRDDISKSTLKEIQKNQSEIKRC